MLPVRLTPKRVDISSSRYCRKVRSAAASGDLRSSTLAYRDEEGEEIADKQVLIHVVGISEEDVIA